MEYIASQSRLSRYLKDYRSMYYYLNKATRLPALRRSCSALVRLCLPAPDSQAPQGMLSDLKQNGIVMLPSFLDAPTVTRLRQYLDSKPVHDARDLEQKIVDMRTLDRNKHIKLRYFYEDVAACEDVVRIANDPRVLGLIGSYFGCKPTISIMEAWWTKAGEQPPTGASLYQDDMYHRDVEDFKFAKLFIYLSNVGEKNGAHCYIKESHLSSKLVRRGPISDEQAALDFAPDKRVVLTGEAGTAFIEDTWGLHRSLPALEGERLLLCFTYSLTSFNPQSPRKPLAANHLNVDPYINRVYLQAA